MQLDRSRRPDVTFAALGAAPLVAANVDQSFFFRRVYAPDAPACAGRVPRWPRDTELLPSDWVDANVVPAPILWGSGPHPSTANEGDCHANGAAARGEAYDHQIKTLTDLPPLKPDERFVATFLEKRTGSKAANAWIRRYDGDGVALI